MSESHRPPRAPDGEPAAAAAPFAAAASTYCLASLPMPHQPQGATDRDATAGKGAAVLTTDPAAPVDLAAFAARLFALTDEIVERAVRAAADNGQPMTCARGCGACCRQLVTISPAEAWMIETIVVDLPPAERHGREARFARAERRLTAAGLMEALDRLDDPRLSAAEHYALAERYFRLGLACPFLDDGACAIYERRPLLCREYCVTSPAADCAEPFARPPRPLPLLRRPSDALAALSARRLRREITPVPLSLALRWARANAAARDATICAADRQWALFEAYLDIQ